MRRITTLSGAARFSKNAQKGGKTVGFVVGSFDIIHLGHINLFRFAKKHIDNLIVGLDNDQTIRLVKGENRPINNFNRRSELLSDLETIDKIFEIKTISHHDTEEALASYRKLVKEISPTHIFTHKICDKHWDKKKAIAKEMKIRFLLDNGEKITNSGKIIKILSTEL
jgi:cytidyltransferase-like protein